MEKGRKNFKDPIRINMVLEKELLNRIDDAAKSLDLGRSAFFRVMFNGFEQGGLTLKNLKKSS